MNYDCEYDNCVYVNMKHVHTKNQIVPLLNNQEFCYKCNKIYYTILNNRIITHCDKCCKTYVSSAYTTASSSGCDGDSDAALPCCCTCNKMTIKYSHTCEQKDKIIIGDTQHNCAGYTCCLLFGIYTCNCPTNYDDDDDSLYCTSLFCLMLPVIPWYQKIKKNDTIIMPKIYQHPYDSKPHSNYLVRTAYNYDDNCEVYRPNIEKYCVNCCMIYKLSDGHCCTCKKNYIPTEQTHCIECHSIYNINEMHCFECCKTYNTKQMFHCNICHLCYNIQYKSCPSCHNNKE